LISFVGELGLKQMLHESVILSIFEQLFQFISDSTMKEASILMGKIG
jgi:hypothetical protein